MPELRLFQVRVKDWLNTRRIKRAWLRRRAPAAAAVLAALIACHLVVWLVLAHLARGKVEQYLARHGDWVTAKSVGTGGYPLHVEVQLGAVSAQQAHLSITAPLVTVRMGLAAAHAYSVATPDGLTVALDQRSLGARMARLSLSGTSEEAPFGAATLRMGGLELADATRADSLELAVTLPAAVPATETGEAARFNLDVSRLVLPERVGALGSTVHEIQLGGVINGRFHEGQIHEVLGAWRDGGGAVELHQARLDWGSFTASGEGTLVLDKDLQPQAAFTATVDGWQDLLQALADSGVMKPDAARIVRFGLTLISPPDATSAIRVPVTLQNGTLYLEKAKIVRVPPIVWPVDGPAG